MSRPCPCFGEHRSMRHRLVLWAVVLPLAASCAQVFAASPGRPNVLVILTDDQRADAIGLGGSRT